MPAQVYARTVTSRCKPGKRGEAIILLRELEGIFKLPLPIRCYAAQTGDRNVLVTYAESDVIAELFERNRNADPDELSAWGKKWQEVVVPGSQVDQIWEVL